MSNSSSNKNTSYKPPKRKSWKPPKNPKFKPPKSKSWKPPKNTTYRDDLKVVRINPVTMRSLQVGLPALGAVLLLATVADYLHILLPLKLWEPREELAVMAKLVNGMWGLILGFSFILLPLSAEMRLLSLRLRALLSWLALLFAILFLGVIPLVVRDTYRMAQWVEAQGLEAEIQVRRNRETSLSNLEGLQSRDELAFNLTRLGVPAKELEGKEDSQLRLQLQDLAENVYAQSQEQISEKSGGMVFDFYKDGAKWSFHALLASLSLGSMWWYSRAYRIALREMKVSTLRPIIETVDDETTAENGEAEAQAGNDAAVPVAAAADPDGEPAKSP